VETGNPPKLVRRGYFKSVCRGERAFSLVPPPACVARSFVHAPSSRTYLPKKEASLRPRCLRHHAIGCGHSIILKESLRTVRFEPATGLTVRSKFERPNLARVFSASLRSRSSEFIPCWGGLSTCFPPLTCFRLLEACPMISFTRLSIRCIHPGLSPRPAPWFSRGQDAQ